MMKLANVPQQEVPLEEMMNKCKHLQPLPVSADAVLSSVFDEYVRVLSHRASCSVQYQSMDAPPPYTPCWPALILL